MAATSRDASRKPEPEGRSPDTLAQNTLLYLYCVLEPGTEAEQLLRSGRVEGLDPTEPLFPIEAEGLIAAVSRVPMVDFAEEALNELVTDLPRLAPLVVRHEGAVRTLYAAAPALVPMAFGAVYREPEGVVRFLTAEAERLASLLDAVRGRQEWGVKVFADAAELRSAAERSSAALRALDDEARTAGPGRAYLLQRKREEMLASETRGLLGAALETIMELLGADSNATRLDDIPRDQDGPTELVLKAAFLIEGGAAQAFQARAAEMKDAYLSQGLSVEVTGPWAPYSFTGARSNGA